MGVKAKPEALKKISPKSHHAKDDPRDLPNIVVDIDQDDNPNYTYFPQPKELWDSLFKAGIVKHTDRWAFQRWIELQHQYREAMKDLSERGLILDKGKGHNERYNPSWRMARDASDAMLRLEAEFGLTPSSKRKFTEMLKVVEVKTEDDYAEMRLRNRK